MYPLAMAAFSPSPDASSFLSGSAGSGLPGGLSASENTRRITSAGETFPSAASRQLRAIVGSSSARVHRSVIVAISALRPSIAALCQQGVRGRVTVDAGQNREDQNASRSSVCDSEPGRARGSRAHGQGWSGGAHPGKPKTKANGRPGRRASGGRFGQSCPRSLFHFPLAWFSLYRIGPTPWVPVLLSWRGG